MTLEHISDTARWMAYVRSIESDRPDALFRDPHSRQLAGQPGESLALQLGSVALVSNSIAIRTAVLDRLIREMVAKHKIELVVNIGSGLDTRPWRLPLPEQLHWLDVDLPALLDHKAQVLRGQRTFCHYDTFPADIRNADERVAALAAHPEATRILAITEGLLVYLLPAQVDALAGDLHRRPACQWWLADLVGPRALHRLREFWAPRMEVANFGFGPADSIAYFSRLGWREQAFYSLQEEARRVRRAPHVGWLASLSLKLASNSFREEMRRLAGVVVLAREGP